MTGAVALLAFDELSDTNCKSVTGFAPVFLVTPVISSVRMVAESKFIET